VSGDILAIVQTFAIVAGMIVMLMRIGRRDQVLEQTDRGLQELSAITKDLLRSVVALSTTVKHHDEMMKGISRRVERLEHKD